MTSNVQNLVVRAGKDAVLNICGNTASTIYANCSPCCPVLLRRGVYYALALF